MRRETIKVTKAMAMSLAKNLLGKVEFVEKSYLGYIFRSGRVQIEINEKSDGFSSSVHDYFDNDLETNKPYSLPCYKVWWHVPGQYTHSVCYYKMNDNYDSICYSYKPDDEE